jgi:hypothetical protein
MAIWRPKKDIALKCGQFGWDYLIVHDDGRDHLIQQDQDYPGVAKTFGWRGLTKRQLKKSGCREDDYVCLERAEIGPAGDFLSRKCSSGGWTRAADPGYFEGLRRQRRQRRR